MKNSSKTLFLAAAASLPLFAMLNGTAFSAQAEHDSQSKLNQSSESTQRFGNSALDVMEIDAFDRDGPGLCKACNRVVLSSEEASLEEIPAPALTIHSQVGT